MAQAGLAPSTLGSVSCFTSNRGTDKKLSNNPLFIAMCGLTEEEVKYAIKEANIIIVLQWIPNNKRTKWNGIKISVRKHKQE